MKAITIRKNNVLISYGPNDGNYDPVVPIGAIRAIEDDYITVQMEFIASQPPVKTSDEQFKDKFTDLITMDIVFRNRIKALLV